MSEEFDYGKIGLKSGLEIHQQLDTKKLFCDCPSVLISASPDFLISRRLHSVAGESGKVDIAAEFQASLGKEFEYEGHYDNSCLVELDEEPPHQLNSEALKIALQISLLLNAEPLKTTQIMRKTVIDGSNTSGFQRTVLIALNGYIETSFGKVGIDTIALEEDSARLVEKKDDQVIYRLDRLGIPLVEIRTSPDMKTPEQIKEAALKIGEILRACKVRRGIGTIRQDVNISVKGHDRVEIKGFQDPKMMIKTIEFEIQRQLDDLKKEKKQGEVRNALPDGKTEFLRPLPGAARMYPETDLSLLRISKKLIDHVKKSRPRLRSDLKQELKKQGLNEELIKLVLQEKAIDEFKELMIVRKDPNLIAKILILYPKEFGVKKGFNLKKTKIILHKDILVDVLEALNSGKISESQVKEVLERVLDGIKIQKALIFKKEDRRIIEERIMKIIKEKPGLSEKAYMGLLMQEFKGKISGKELMEMIRKHVG